MKCFSDLFACGLECCRLDVLIRPYVCRLERQGIASSSGHGVHVEVTDCSVPWMDHFFILLVEGSVAVQKLCFFMLLKS